MRKKMMTKGKKRGGGKRGQVLTVGHWVTQNNETVVQRSPLQCGAANIAHYYYCVLQKLVLITQSICTTDMRPKKEPIYVQFFTTFT